MAVSPPRFGIVASRFHYPITERLVQAALEFLRTKKVSRRQVEVTWVPGAFELPVAALRLARRRGAKKCRAIIALGCILRGGTRNDRYLASATLTGLATASVLTGVPIASGVVTAQSWSIALARSLRRGTNRGREAAQAAWEMARTVETL